MKKALISIISLVLLAFLFTLISGYSLVLPYSGGNELNNMDCNNGTINPLGKFDFSKGKWEMYIVLSSDDRNNLPSSIRKVNCFKTNDKLVLKSLQQNWSFECQGGDMATVDSDLYLIHDGNIVFSSGLMINSSQEGLQSEKFGWIFSKNNLITSNLVKFNRVYSPIIVL